VKPPMKIRHKGFSVFTGGEVVEGICDSDNLAKTPLMEAFINDQDIQEMTITSANIGFSRTFTKIFEHSGG
jgi:hypothetical protein